MNPMVVVLQVIAFAAVCGIIIFTLALNTKSEGLGAAITGASDTYRGAVGVEEQKRRMLQYLCYGFIVVSFLVAFVDSWF